MTPNGSALVTQIVVILAVCKAMGAVFRNLRQPQVVGEMLAGILLGPSLLGSLTPKLWAVLFPASSLDYFSALSHVGVIIFMFMVGLGIDPRQLKNYGHAAVLTSHASISVPFALASVLALYLYPKVSDSTVTFTSFVLFLGTAMSITAFPVLARILMERNLQQSRLGSVALTCAAVDDITGWCILSCVVSFVRVEHASTPIWFTLTGIISFVSVMVYGVRRLLQRFEIIYRERGILGESVLGLMILLVFLSARLTEWLGIHPLFGAFLMGAIMPKQEGFVRFVLDRFETITVGLLLPLFFAYTGLRTRIDLIRGREMWICCGAIVLVAIGGKLGGSTAASWLAGMPFGEAVALGTLMNTRGLMELVVLNIGLDLKVISPPLFSMLVMMALTTTAMTGPALDVIYRSRRGRLGNWKTEAIGQQS
jgi:Kef-type K+ transport system membrane component KefB